MGLILDAALRSPQPADVPRSTAIHRVLNGMVRSGFARTRYYELDFNVPSTDRRGFEDLAVLAQTLSAESETVQAPLGYAIEWKSTASYQLARGLKAVYGSANRHASEHPEALSWIRQLGLSGRSFVDIPLIRNGQPVGLIAADWNGPEHLLSKADLAYLQDVGLILGSLAESEHLTVPPLRAANIDPLALVQDACREIMGSINAAFGAVFQLDWRRGRLVKIVEYFDDGLDAQCIETAIEERTYDIDDGFLTGRAWADSEYRYVADIESLAAAKPDWVDMSSSSQHRQVHGHPVKTVFYSVVGTQEQRYLIRFMNRSDAPNLPFLRRRRQVATQLTQQLASRVDYAVAARRVQALAEISRTAVAHLHSPERLVPTVIEALLTEGVDDFIYLSTTAKDGIETFSYHTATLASFLRSGAARETLAELLKTSFEDDPRLENRTLHFDKPGDAWPEDRVLTICSRSDLSNGFLLMPVANVSSAINDAYYGSLQVYCDLLTTSVDAQSMFISEEGARRALGYIGHEIGTPFTVLGDAAVAVAVEGLHISDELGLAMPALKQRLRQTSQHSYSLVQRARDEIDRVMEIAPLLASMGSGELNLFFLPVDLTDIFKIAYHRILTETRGSQPVPSGARVRSSSRKFEVIFSDSLDRLPIICGDAGSLTQVAMNLLRNAVKYSLPRHPPEPMSVRVSGQQMENGLVSVTVTNWGWGIPPELQPRVFRPFVRGQTLDRLKSLPGMGIGLYLVQTIVRAHSGTVICRSNATLKDERPDEPLFGWETVFEVRLPLGLPAGPHSAVIDPYKSDGW